MTRKWLVLIVTLLLAGLMAACGGAQPTPDRVATRVAEDLAVSATLTARAPQQPTGAVAQAADRPTATRAQAAVVPIATQAPAPDTAIPEPVCQVVSAGLNLRPGPGTAFNPPIATLPQDTRVRPLSFVGRGVPSGQWVEVKVEATGQRGWISAGSESLSCAVDVTTLPAGVTPATPVPATTTPAPAAATPTPSPTRVQVAVVPVDGNDGGNNNVRNDLNVNSGRNVRLPGFAPEQVANPVVFHDRIVFQVEVFDRAVGHYDGAGIQSVRFNVTDGTGKTVLDQTENTAGYCAFGGGEPMCTVWYFSEHNNHWPNGAVLHPGLHNVQITITPKSGNDVTWVWKFRIQ